MQLKRARVELLKPDSSTLDGIYKAIEEAGRTCYKSNMGNDPKAFVDMLIKNGHLSMLEHGTVYLKAVGFNNSPNSSHALDQRHIKNPFSTVRLSYTDKEYFHRAWITTNLRVLVENNWLDDLDYMVSMDENHVPRYSARFICSRACAQQLTRHRVFSFAMQSQRYCNYSKDKFGNEITFILPEWYKGDVMPTAGDMKERLFYLQCKQAEGAYFDLLNEGASPQEARVVLPNATATEVIMTGTSKQWEEFFLKRAFDKTGKSDAEIHRLANELHALL